MRVGPEDAYIALVGLPEVSISAPSSICIGGVDGADGNFSYQSLQMSITASNDKVLSGGTSSFGGYGVSSSSSLQATFEPLLAVQAFQQAQGSQPISGVKEFIESSLSIEISYTWDNQYGGISCPTTETADIVVNGLPSVHFSAPTKGIDSEDDIDAEVCVNEPPFSG